MKAVTIACLMCVLVCTTATSSRLGYLTRHDPNNHGTTGGRNTLIERLQGMKHRSIQHHSLIPPHLQGMLGGVGLAHADHTFPPSSGGMAEVIPFWGWEETTGSTVLTDDYVRLTPNDGSRHGALWNLEPINDIPAFELVVGFKIHSPHTLGADGMAIWIADRIPSDKEARPWFGMVKEMRGLGILLDSYDNDGGKDNPRISLVYKSEVNPPNAHEWDTGKDFKGAALGSCQVDFRNKGDLSAIILRYRPGGNVELVVATSNMEVEHPCVNLESSEIAFPKYDIIKDGNSNPHLTPDSPRVVEAQHHNSGSGYHIGVTAATGGVSDNHDVYFVALFPIKGYNYDHDVFELPESHGDHHSENAIHVDEEEGKSTKVYNHNKDKNDREYWRKKTPMEEQLIREEEQREKEFREKKERDRKASEQAEADHLKALAEERANHEAEMKLHAEKEQQRYHPPANQQQYQQQPPAHQQYASPNQVPSQQQQIPQQQQYQQQQQQPPVYEQQQQQPPAQQYASPNQVPSQQQQIPQQQQYQQQQQQPPVNQQQYHQQQQPPVNQQQVPQQPPAYQQQQYQQQPPAHQQYASPNQVPSQQQQIPQQQQYQQHQQPPVNQQQYQQQQQPPARQQYSPNQVPPQQQQGHHHHQQQQQQAPAQHQQHHEQRHPHHARQDPYQNGYQ